MDKSKRFKLIEARQRKGLTQKDLAGYLYVSQAGMSKIENGMQNITHKQQIVLRELLGIDVSTLNEISAEGEFKSEINEMRERKRILDIDLQIAEILILVEKKGIDFDTFHRRLQYFEKLKNEREVV